MDKFALVLAVVAVALGAYAAFGQESGTSGAAADSDAGPRLLALEDRLNELSARLDASEGRGGDLGAAALRGSSAEGTPNAPATVGEVEDLRREITALKEQVQGGKSVSGLPEGLTPEKLAGSISRGFRHRFLTRPEDVRRALDLTDEQDDEIGRIIDDTRARLDELYTTPNDDGKTWREISQPKFDRSKAKDGRMIFAMPDVAAMNKFKNTTVPGTNETYAQAERRIRREADRNIERGLDDEQRKKWDDAQTDMLYGNPMSGGNVSVAFGSVIEEDDK